ncbi:NADH-cytochrome b5 reductase-like [Drosophila guanche]|uniref:Blast:NADH-cytochrome b5 reductase-like n=1 Tax=Drosophila guanche TaxID=7266 RepID=A0A3B0K2Z5_DROGU|nr:NADH-cytochrome b5 reductase-like [Drosophila guanche]SPP88645.1 blast:NADH-cytochrome b5 reductase-like [Drosophila guanche]
MTANREQKVEDVFTIQDSDCCGNGCTNCILDNKPRPSQRALLAGKRNIILKYTSFRLLQRETHSGDDQVLFLHFGNAAESDDKDDCVLDIPPGHHIMLRIGSLLRPYSPYWTDFASKEFKILVKLQPDGPMSQHLVAVQPNDRLEFRGPIGNYRHDSAVTKCIYIICQGVAVAPTLPLVGQVLENEDDMSRIWHLMCAPDLQHVYFRDQLLEFAKYWNYRSCLYVPHQQCGSDACLEAGHCRQECDELRRSLRYKERVCLHRLEANELKQHVAPAIPGLPVLIIAGDSGFQRAMGEAAAKALGVAQENVYLL